VLNKFNFFLSKHIFVFLSRFGTYLESFLRFASAFLKTIRTNSTTQWITSKSL